MNINCSYTRIADVDSLVENPKNPNKHPEKQIEMLAKILKYQGWRHPIIVSQRSGFIVSGNGRLMAAKKNGWTEVPIDEQDFENEAAEFAHLIADNKIAELAEHDDELMKSTAIELDLDQDFDLDLFGVEHLSLVQIDDAILEDKANQEELDKKFILEVQFPNYMEMMDVHDDLLSRGYIVRVK